MARVVAAGGQAQGEQGNVNQHGFEKPTGPLVREVVNWRDPLLLPNWRRKCSIKAAESSSSLHVKSGNMVPSISCWDQDTASIFA